MNCKDIEQIMARVPQLNAFGIGVFEARRKTPDNRASELESEREELRNSVDACNKCCQWLRGNISKIKTINQRHTSYGLKHLAEKDIGYITNGVFICAAIHCGFPYKLTDGPNVRFGMSERSITQIEKRRDA